MVAYDLVDFPHDHDYADNENEPWRGAHGGRKASNRSSYMLRRRMNHTAIHGMVMVMSAIENCEQLPTYPSRTKQHN